MIDHWLWATKGLQGIVGMLNELEAGGVPASPEVLELLAKYAGELKGHHGREQDRQREAKRTD